MKQTLRKLMTLPLMIALSFLGMSLHAQSYVEIAPNNMANMSMDGRPLFEQMIYTKAEMGNQARTLYGIELSRLTSSISRDTVVLLDIYLGETSRDTFYNATSWENPQNLTRVFTGTYHFVAGHDKDTIVFDQPFEYSGTQNLTFTIFEHCGTNIGSGRYIQFRAHTVSNNKGVYMYYMKYGIDQIDMNNAGNWSTAAGHKINTRYNIKFFFNSWYMQPQALPTVQANYQASFTNGANQAERTWKTYGSEGCWWEFHGGDTGAMFHDYGNNYEYAMLVSPIIEVNNNGTSKLTFSVKNQAMSDSLRVYYCINGYNDWHLLADIDYTYGFQQKEIPLPACQSLRIAFKASWAPSYDEPVCIKNVSVNNVPVAMSSSQSQFYSFVYSSLSPTGSSYQSKYISFGLNSINSAPTVISSSYQIDAQAAEYADGQVYYIGGIRSDFALYSTSFDDNGELPEGQMVGELDYTHDYLDMAYDRTSETMYALETDDDGCNLVTIDLEDGTRTLETSFDIKFTALAAHPSGVLYAISGGESNRLYIIYPWSNYPEMVSDVPMPICDNYSFQGFYFDQNSGKLIFANYYDYGNANGVYGIDPQSGEWEYYGKPGGMNMHATGLFTIATTPTADVVSTINFYGMDHTPTNDEEGVYIDLVNFTMQNPSEYSNICRMPSNEKSIVLNCEYINDTLFYILFNLDDNDDESLYTLYKMPFNGNQMQATPTTVWPTDPESYETLFGLAYNPGDEKLYTILISYDTITYELSIRLCSINRDNGTLTTVLNLDGLINNVPSAIAIGPNNTVYAIAQDDRGANNLFSIGANGINLVGNTGIYSDGMFQGMYADPTTGEMFWVCYDERNDNISSTIYKLDLTTGQAATIGSMGDMNILTCFFLQHTTTPQEGIENASVAVNIWPNPASERINVTSEAQITMLQLYDMQGSLVRLQGRNFGNEATLDISNIPAGAYLLRTTTSKGSNLQKIIVKQ